MQQLGPFISSYGLENHGIKMWTVAHWNYTTSALYEEALRRHEGNAAPGGALVCHTGLNTGRAPNDKFIVEEPTSKDDIAWGDINRPIEQAKFDAVHKRFMAYLQGRDIFIQDCFAGPTRNTGWRSASLPRRRGTTCSPATCSSSRKPVSSRISSPASPSFNRPTSIPTPRPTAPTPRFSSLVDHERRMVLIGGTGYAGEIKKSVFSIMNYLLPAKGILPMHASANVGPNGDSALFFGLSGTGKTTLSADSSRTLVGDGTLTTAACSISRADATPR